MAVDPVVVRRISDLLCDYLEDVSEIDACAEPVAIRAGTAMVLVRLIDSEPAVLRVYSPLVREVAASPELLAELNDLNGRLSFLRVFWRDGCVFAATELIAETLAGNELEFACDLVSESADHYDVLLQERFGGHVTFVDDAGS